MNRSGAVSDGSKSVQDANSSNNAQIVQEYVVRIPKVKQKCFNIMRFSNALRVDVTKWTQAKMERENNLKEFKADEDMPKFGAGSEFGREQREESRRKKFGIVVKKYNPDEQPWILKLNGKNGKKFKGIREGGVTENTSYYVFTQASDGTFEAFPVEEWYNFTPIQCYKALSAEEAEEEFGRRDKVLNFFSIMVKKRLQSDNAEDEDDDEKKQNSKKKGKQQKDFKITDMDDWAFDSGDSEGNEDDAEDGPGAKDKVKKSGKRKGNEKKKKKEKSDEEAVEESDEGDFDDKEVDYMTDSSSEEDEPEEEKVNKELKSVADEEALRKLDMSEDEDEQEEEENKDTEEPSEVKEKPSETKSKSKVKKEKDSSGESSSESSDSDLDDTKYQSVMFMQEAKRKNGSGNSASSSRANTPTRNYNDNGQKSQKRKLPESNSISKKQKLDNQSGSSTTTTTASSSFTSGGLDGINEDAVKRYLARKPMTASEILQKFKNKRTKLNADQLVNKIADVLKKMDLVKTNIKGKLYLSLRT